MSNQHYSIMPQPNYNAGDSSSKLKKYTIGYLDGWVIAALTYYLSPPEDKLRNTLIIGAAHGILHHYACDFMHMYESKEELSDEIKYLMGIHTYTINKPRGSVYM